jgi:hypothetical protein
VVASGTTPITYQWKKNGANIGGATSPSLALSPVNPVDAGSYTCLVTNALGSDESDPAVLTVLTNAGCNDGQFCNGLETCAAGACVDNANPCAEACRESNDTCQPYGTMSCSLSSTGVSAGGQVVAGLFLNQVLDLHGYQTKLRITRTSGTGDVSISCPDGIEIDITRPDYVFLDEGPFNAFDCENGRMASAIFSAVEVPVSPKYLGDYLLSVSGDAAVGSTFEVSLEPEAEDTTFLRDSIQQPIPYHPGSPCVLTITACAVYGDVAQPLNGIVNIDDIICILNGFGNFATCLLGDIAPCGGNGIIDLNDILAVLAAFSGNDPCCGG